MKKLITICMLSLFSVALNAQTLNGTQDFTGIRGGSICYTVLNWSVNYQIYEEGVMFYISLSNPKVSVAYNSLYGSYSKSDLGLSSWPNPNQTPYNFQLTLTIKHPDGSNHSVLATLDRGNYIDKKDQFKNTTATASSFKVVSVESMHYNGGSDNDIDKLIEAKKNNQNKDVTNSQNLSTSSGNQTNTKQTQSNVVPAQTQVNTPIIHTSNTSTQIENFQKGYVTGQKIAEVTTGLVDLFTPSPEQIQRREQEAVEYARQKKIKEDYEFEKRKVEGESRFRVFYLPLMDQAIKGDENARMILYFSSYRLLSTRLVPQSEKWLDQAYKNNNVDAILEKAPKWKENRSYDIIEGIPYYERAASLGSTDAMLRLATWYDRKKTSYGYGGENPKLALEYYTKAANLGSPNAMYYLGMIYKYGIVEDLHDGRGMVNFRRKMHVKYDVPKNEKIAFEWFTKSIQPDYKISAFYRGCYETMCAGSYFNKESYKELAIMYKQGKVVPNNIQKAKELKKNYETFILDREY